jgi:hypothetical protein
MKINNRKSVYVPLKEWCTFSMSSEKNLNDYMEVTQWTNGEGFDIDIETNQSSSHFKLTWGQLRALTKIYKEHFKDQ